MQIIERISKNNSQKNIIFLKTSEEGWLHNAIKKSKINTVVTAVSYTHLDVYKRQEYILNWDREKKFKSVKIGADIAAADSMIVMSHFKGHIVAGFGGVIKNLAMALCPCRRQEGPALQYKPIC